MKENKDISAPMAMMLFAIVGCAVGFFMYREQIIGVWDRLVPVAHSNSKLLLSTSGSILLNVILFAAMFERFFGFKEQGSRLRSIKGERLNIVIMQIFALSIVLYLPIYFFYLDDYVGSGVKLILSGFNKEYIILGERIVHGTFFVTTLFLSSYVLNFSKIVGELLKKLKFLPRYPKKENEIVLGSIGEERSFDEVNRPKWMKLNQKALNGNILVTGSIGSGKTQGTVLSYIEQILDNFWPRPSMLILDPKRTLIPEVIKMAETNGLKEIKL